MRRHHVAALILDEDNLAEMARHAVSAPELEQVISNRHITAPNPRGEAGSILLIGETNGGRVLTIPLDRRSGHVAPRDRLRRLLPPAHALPAAREIGHHWDMRAEDYDAIDESAVEVHEGHPVDIIVSVPLTAEESRLLHELAERESSEGVETIRAAVRHYAADSPRRAAG